MCTCTWGGVWRVEANIWGQKMEMEAQWELLGVWTGAPNLYFVTLMNSLEAEYTAYRVLVLVLVY